jgi:hypothetical protein
MTVEDKSEALEGQLIKKQVGRPSCFTEDMIKTMLDAKDQGASDTQVMKMLGVCRDTFYRWLRENPEFKEAHNYAKIAEEVHWDRVGEFGIMNPKAVNGPLYVSYMKKRFKSWRESVAPESAQQNSINIQNMTVNNVASLSTEELEKQVHARLEALKAANPDLLEKLMHKNDENA